MMKAIDTWYIRRSIWALQPLNTPNCTAYMLQVSCSTSLTRTQKLEKNLMASEGKSYTRTRKLVAEPGTNHSPTGWDLGCCCQHPVWVTAWHYTWRRPPKRAWMKWKGIKSNAWQVSSALADISYGEEHDAALTALTANLQMDNVPLGRKSKPLRESFYRPWSATAEDIQIQPHVMSRQSLVLTLAIDGRISLHSWYNRTAL